MQGRIRPVEDHEEWRLLAAESETGVYVMQGLVMGNTDTEIFVNTQKLAKKIIKRLYRRQGWDRRFEGMVAPFTTARAPKRGDPNYGKPGSYVTDLSKKGGWLAVVPTDYLEELDNRAAMCFDLTEYKPRFSVWAAEVTAIRTRGEGFPMLPEFEYRAEYAIHKGVLMKYNDHPDAKRMTRRAGLL